jgi:hypothetical protein
MAVDLGKERKKEGTSLFRIFLHRPGALRPFSFSPARTPLYVAQAAAEKAATVQSGETDNTQNSKRIAVRESECAVRRED